MSLQTSTRPPSLLNCGRVVRLVAFLIALSAMLGSSRAEAQTMSIGNCVFADWNNNGHFDNGEGISGVRVELWKATGDPNEPYAQHAFQITDANGLYLFQSLTTGTYYVRIPDTEFKPGGPLAGMESMPGNQLVGDDDQGEDGVDTFGAFWTGVNSIEMTVTPGFGPTAAQGETGFHSADDDGSSDTNSDLTVDFGFYRPVGIGNLVFADMNGNGHADPGEGIPGVVVQLFRGGDTPGVDNSIADVSTSSSGTYGFGSLVPGSYKVHIPASQFAPGAPLDGAFSVSGTGGATDDDNAANGDNGIDDLDPATNGITTAVITLASGLAPTNSGSEQGAFNTDDDELNGISTDADQDYTIDFGFVFQPGKVGVGNIVFVDNIEANGHYDDGEGMPGVLVQLFAQGQNPLTDPPIATRTTLSDGHYLFANLTPGSYFLRIPASEFAPGKPLFSALSLQDTFVGGDDQVSEDGIDTPYPELFGINTNVFSLAVGNAPTGAGSELGFGSDQDDFRDSSIDLTRDFGFRLRAASPLSVGNLVFNDADGDGKLSQGEQGIAGVQLQLFHEFDDISSTPPVATRTTAANGTYLFDNLTPGRYFVHVPATQFQAGGALEGLQSSTGNGGDDNNDDNTDENGIDSAAPALDGISSIVFELSEGLEPVEHGAFAAMDDTNDTNGDMTIDFGFALNCPPLAIFPTSLNQATRLQLFNVQFNLVGGNAPITWTVSSGSIPPGITLDTNTGVFSGIPTQAGTFTFTIRGVDGGGCLTHRAYSMNVQPAFNLGVGNSIFIDSNHNGQHDSGEGINGVTMQLFHEGDVPGVDAPLAQTISAGSGLYAFDSLQPGRYFVHVPASEFQLGGLLYNKVSAPGYGLDSGIDDDKDENGVDSPNPFVTGISSISFDLTEGTEPTDSGKETGIGATNDNTADSNFDATIDFGFVDGPQISVSVGNLVFRDLNNNHVFDEGEGVDNVKVYLFDSAANPQATLPIRSTVTANGGRYLFSSLTPGTYKVFIPASEFAQGKPLYGFKSIPGAGADGAADDNVDENGIDSATPATTGIVSTNVTLALGSEPQNSDVEKGASNTSDDAADANADLTVDFGFELNCPTITISPSSLGTATINQSFSQQISAADGLAPYTFTKAFGTLPDGMTLTSAGLLSGTPTQVGTFTFGIQATDSFTCFAVMQYTLTVLSPPLGVGNLVFFDANGNGHADEGEGVDGVTVKLFTSTQDPQIDAALTQVTTSGGGRFLIDNLQPGDYKLFIPASNFASSAPLWQLVSKPGVLTTGDDSVGEDGEDAIAPATSGVVSAVFHLGPGTAPEGIDESGLSGNSDDARDADIDLTRDFGFVDATNKPATFNDWRSSYGIGTGATGNSDGDGLSNLMEYAFGSNPTSGLENPASTCFCVVDNQNTNTVTLQLRRRHGGQGDLTYTVQLLNNLGQSPASWTTVTLAPTITNNGDGTETLTFAGIDSDPAVTGSVFGFARVLVSLDADHNGTPEASEASFVLGWEHRTVPTRNQTYAIPFVAPAVLTGTVGAVTGDALDLTLAASGGSIASALESGREYYVEVISGVNEGHRFEINEASTTASTVALIPSHSLSTQTSTPTSLVGDVIAIRPHWRVIDLFPIADFHATTNPNTADQLILWSNSTSAYTTLWLANTPFGVRWVRVGDISYANQGNTIVGPLDGLFVRPKVGPVNAAATGVVRSWKSACPLKAGVSFIGNPYPVNVSPADRQMTVAKGFTANINSNLADRFNFWNGDTTTDSTYSVYYKMLTPTGEIWRATGTTSLTDYSSTKFFNAGTAAFITSKNGLSTWVLPVPWTP